VNRARRGAHALFLAFRPIAPLFIRTDDFDVHPLLRRAGQEEPPLRFAAGADAIATVEKKANDLLAQADAHRELSASLAIEEA
jgi:hypothetical protein